MAGRGRPPKPAGLRSGHSKDPTPTRALKLVRRRQPPLPRAIKWHPQTRAWWRTWAKSELTRDFTADDWSFLLDTALLHHTMWSEGMPKLAGEIRLRVAKFGQTPEDRARLRLTLRDPLSLIDGESPAVRAARSSASGVKQPGRRDDPRLRVLTGLQ